jgi:hypothetical protein
MGPLFTAGSGSPAGESSLVNMITSLTGRAARDRATAQDKATLQEAVRQNEAAVAKGGAPALSGETIDRMSVGDLDRYFAADRAGDTVTREGDHARLIHHAVRDSLISLACLGGTIAFPPLMVAGMCFAVLALTDKARANGTVLEANPKDMKATAHAESQALLERARTADPQAAAEERQSLLARLPEGVPLEDAFTQEGDWLRNDA